MAAFAGMAREAKNESLTLAELLATARRTEADLLTLNFACITGDKTSLAQGRLEGHVIVDQCTGNAVAHCASLAGLAAAVNVDHDVKRFDVVRQKQGLAADHDGGLATEEHLNVLVVNRDLASAFFQKHAGDA